MSESHSEFGDALTSLFPHSFFELKGEQASDVGGTTSYTDKWTYQPLKSSSKVV
jgi:hypothetical protein